MAKYVHTSVMQLSVSYVCIIWFILNSYLIMVSMTTCIRTYICKCVVSATMYSQTSLVSTPGDPPNCYSLSVVLANHIRRLVLWVTSWGIISLHFLTRYYSLTVFLLMRFYCMYMNFTESELFELPCRVHVYVHTHIRTYVCTCFLKTGSGTLQPVLKTICI